MSTGGIRNPRGGFTALFAEVFSDAPRVPAGRYAVYNAVLGGFLLLLATIQFLEPERWSSASAIGLGSVGLLLQSGIVVSTLRSDMPPRVLLFSGLLLGALTVAFTISSIEWAWRAPPLSPFRYMPGVVLLLGVYGALQVAASRPSWQHAKRLKLVGLCVSLLCELAVMAALIVRGLRT
jgi:hypothetical protein